jgi:hypothetical protein
MPQSILVEGIIQIRGFRGVVACFTCLPVFPEVIGTDAFCMAKKQKLIKKNRSLLIEASYCFAQMRELGIKANLKQAYTRVVRLFLFNL